MNNLQNKWLITGGIVALTVLLTVFAGLGISKMTGTKTPEKDKTEEAVTEIANASEETDSTKENEAPEETKENAESDSKSSEEPSFEEAEKTSAEETPVSSAADESTPDETAPQESTEESSTETAAPESTAPAEPASEIRLLSAEEIAEIRANYGDAVQGFYIGGSPRDENNRPTSCVSRNDELNAKFGNVVFFGPDTAQPTAYFTFILTNEFAPNTENLLNSLASLGVKATFFMDKPYAERNQGIVQRIINDGHEIGSMGSSLPEGGLVMLGLDRLIEDVYGFHTYMRDTFGYTMKKFYFSYDSYSDQTMAAVIRMGYKVCFYSANYVDYDHFAAIDVNNLLTSLEYQLHPGCIYSLRTANSASIEVVPHIVNYLYSNGYQIGVLP